MEIDFQVWHVYSSSYYFFIGAIRGDNNWQIFFSFNIDKIYLFK